MQDETWAQRAEAPLSGTQFLPDHVTPTPTSHSSTPSSAQQPRRAFPNTNPMLSLFCLGLSVAAFAPGEMNEWMGELIH